MFLFKGTFLFRISFAGFGLYFFATYVAPCAMAAAPKAASKVVLADFTHLQGAFEQVKKLKDLDVEIRSSGSFEIFRPKGSSPVIHWDLRKPSETKICIDGQGIFVEKSQGATRKSHSVDFDEAGKKTGEQLRVLTNLLAFDLRALEKMFGIVRLANALTVTPKKPAEAFFESATVLVDAKGFAKQVSIQEKTKDELTIVFSNVSDVSSKSGNLKTRCAR